jgi:hypothetical protein
VVTKSKTDYCGSFRMARVAADQPKVHSKTNFQLNFAFSMGWVKIAIFYFLLMPIPLTKYMNLQAACHKHLSAS